jgi:hypothetical protein
MVFWIHGFNKQQKKFFYVKGKIDESFKTHRNQRIYSWSDETFFSG